MHLFVSTLKMYNFEDFETTDLEKTFLFAFFARFLCSLITLNANANEQPCCSSESNANEQPCCSVLVLFIVSPFCALTFQPAVYAVSVLAHNRFQ